MPTPLFQFFCTDCRAEVADEAELVTVPDGTDQPLRLCHACAATCEPSAECPACSSSDVHLNYFSFGVDPETGYHDEAAIFTCAACHATGEAEELVYRPVTELRHIARIQPARAELAVVARARA